MQTSELTVLETLCLHCCCPSPTDVCQLTALTLSPKPIGEGEGGSTMGCTPARMGVLHRGWMEDCARERGVYAAINSSLEPELHLEQKVRLSSFSPFLMLIIKILFRKRCLL